MSDGKYYGMYQGIVSNINDPKKRGRIRVQCPEVLGGSTISAWCDPCNAVSYDGGGDFCLPQVGEGVWLTFIGGNPNRPVYQGGWWQDEQSPHGSSYTEASKSRIINYSNCTITMKSGNITIAVGGGDQEISIVNGKISIKADIEIEGDVKVQGSVTATDLIINKEVLEDGTTAGGNVEVEGKITSKEDIATDMTISAKMDITTEMNITAVGTVHGSNI